MRGQRHSIDYDLASGASVVVTYDHTPGGFSDEEDSYELVSITSRGQDAEHMLSKADWEGLDEAIGENEANSEPSADWRNEW